MSSQEFASSKFTASLPCRPFLSFPVIWPKIKAVILQLYRPIPSQKGRTLSKYQTRYRCAKSYQAFQVPFSRCIPTNFPRICKRSPIKMWRWRVGAWQSLFCRKRYSGCCYRATCYLTKYSSSYHRLSNSYRPLR